MFRHIVTIACRRNEDGDFYFLLVNRHDARNSLVAAIGILCETLGGKLPRSSNKHGRERAKLRATSHGESGPFRVAAQTTPVHSSRCSSPCKMDLIASASPLAYLPRYLLHLFRLRGNTAPGSRRQTFGHARSNFPLAEGCAV